MTMQAVLAVTPLLLLLLWPARRVGAAEYLVGDVGYGWDSGNGINYAAWASKHAFAVGDVLVFQYVSTQHDLYEVPEEVYRSCDNTSAGGGNSVKYTSGYDRVVLAEAREYWFICDFPHHCLGGMRLAVNVSDGATAAGGSSPPTVNTPPDGSSAAASTMTGGRPGRAVACLALVVLALMNIKAL